MKTLRHYIAFKRFSNFACFQIQPQARKILAWVKIDPNTIKLEEGFTRDVSNIGHYGTGDLEISINSDEDFERAQDLFVRSYEGG